MYLKPSNLIHVEEIGWVFRGGQCNGSLLDYCNFLQTRQRSQLKAAKMYYIILYSFGFSNLAASFSWSKKADKGRHRYMYLKVFFIYRVIARRKVLFFSYNNIFHKLLSNKEILVILWLLPYKVCKNNNETWLELILFKNFYGALTKNFYHA